MVGENRRCQDALHGPDTGPYDLDTRFFPAAGIFLSCPGAPLPGTPSGERSVACASECRSRLAAPPPRSKPIRPIKPIKPKLTQPPHPHGRVLLTHRNGVPSRLSIRAYGTWRRHQMDATQTGALPLS